MKLTTHLYLVRKAVPPLPHKFSWYLIKYKDNFTYIFTIVGLCEMNSFFPKHSGKSRYVHAVNRMHGCLFRHSNILQISPLHF
jgi:hypothetical protein